VPKVQVLICHILERMGEAHDISEYLLDAGALPVLFRIITHTTNTQVRCAAVKAVKPISIKDNSQTLTILRAGGLQVLADTLRRIKTTEYNTCLHTVWLLEGLAAIPVYATAMHDMGFVEIVKGLSWFCLNTDTFMGRLEAAAKHPVDA